MPLNLSMLLRAMPAILAAIITALMSYGLHDWSRLRAEQAHRNELTALADSMVAQCEGAQKTTSEVSNEFQGRLDRLNRQLADARRMRSSACVPVRDSGTAAGRNAATGHQQPAGQNAGADRGALIELAGEAERYRLQLIGCQDFVRRVQRTGK